MIFATPARQVLHNYLNESYKLSKICSSTPLSVTSANLLPQLLITIIIRFASNERRQIERMSVLLVRCAFQKCSLVNGSVCVCVSRVMANSNNHPKSLVLAVNIKTTHFEFLIFRSVDTFDFLHFQSIIRKSFMTPKTRKSEKKIKLSLTISVRGKVLPRLPQPSVKKYYEEKRE